VPFLLLSIPSLWEARVVGKLMGKFEELASWFDRQKRVLPWREDPSPYRVWVSEIMLQQTQVVTVVPYFEKFMSRFPSVEDLAHAPLEDVLLHWAGLGYYSRARNLHRTAQKIVEQGRFPVTRAEWLEMPGVGEYTAGAILSISADLPEAILDGNVERVLSRVYCLTREDGDAAYKDALWRRSREWVKSGHQRGINPSRLNQALMELGATTCTYRNPKCLLCPIQKSCKSFATQAQESFPPKKKPKQWVTIEEKLHCILNDRGQVLLRRRREGEWRAGLWDLLPDAPREGVEKLGEVESKHVVTRHKISRKTVVWTQRSHPLLRAAERPVDTELCWVSVKSPEVAVGSALKKTLQRIQERFDVV